MPHRHRPQRIPRRGQRQHLPHHVPAEHRRGHPRRPQPLPGQRHQEVLHSGPGGHHEHLALRRVPPLVPVHVGAVHHQARHRQIRRVAQHIPAPHPLRDGLLALAIAPQIRDPGVPHRVQQPGPRLGGLQQHEPPGRRVMGRRSGHGRRDRPPYGPRIHRLVAELAHRTPQGHRFPYGLGRPQPEHVVGGPAHERPRTGVVGGGGGHDMRQPPHHGDRQPRGLALDQVPGGGQLVRRRHDRGAEGIAVRVRTTAQIVQHPHPRRPDGDIGEPVAPGPPEGVGDDDADLDAEGVPHPVPDGPCGGVGVLGQQEDGPGGGVGGVDPGGGHDEPLPVLHDAERAAPGHDPYGLGVDGGLPVGGPHDPALGLGDDLRGDEEDVPVDEPRLGPGDQLGEIVPGTHFGNAGQSPHPKRGRAFNGRAT